jgi:acetoin utilization protein AcuC
MPQPAAPLLVFGPRSTTYDFGPGHPLTPRRFGPGIDLLRHVGAAPGLAPEPASDEDLLRVHLPEYLATVKRISADPGGRGGMGIGHSDNPAFAGMHEASAAVAGGSLRAMEAILRGDVEHAHHPGGGLHHAMPDRASGFCIYDDPALAVVRARAAGLRVLYLDLDVHHGDGVQAITYDDPGVLTISFHESGRYLFPGTGFVDELGAGAAAGTSVNVPLEPSTGEGAWLTAVRTLVPSLAAAFAPDVIVSQHGADSHAWDPLAHLRVTTTAMGEAARLVDEVAHRHAGGRWLATGGGGYDAYRVVPRAWALTWLAGAHRAFPDATPAAWRERWEAEAAGFGTPGMPATFLDAPNAGMAAGEGQRVAEARSLEVLARVRAVVLPRLVREAEDRGWWSPSAATGSATVSSSPVPGTAPTVRPIGIEELSGVRIAERVASPTSSVDLGSLLTASLSDDSRVIGALAGDMVVGLAVAAPCGVAGTESLLALGVAPQFRRGGLGGALLRELVAGSPAGTTMEARIGVAERDVVDPLPIETRIAIARRLLTGAGFDLRRVDPDVARDDPWAISASRAPGPRT